MKRDVRRQMFDPHDLAWMFLGWRYLLQPSFRRKVHAEWRADTAWGVAVDIFWGTLGVIMAGAIVFAAMKYFLR